VEPKVVSSKVVKLQRYVHFFTQAPAQRSEMYLLSLIPNLVDVTSGDDESMNNGRRAYSGSLV